MKTFKTLFIASVCIVAMNVTAQQRTQMNPQEKTDNIKEHIKEITPDQEAKILTIEQDFEKASQDARTNTKGDAMQAKMESLREDRDAKIKGVLTADQYNQYVQMQKSHKLYGGNKGQIHGKN